MKQFEGFPVRMQYTAVPNLFFSRLMPRIDNMAELKTCLVIFRIIYGKKGSLRYVTQREMLADEGLAESLGGDGKETAEALAEALEKAEKRGTITSLEYETEDSREKIIFVNTAKNRETVEKIRSGEIVPEGLGAARFQAVVADGPLPDIFTLYEENIGLLSPMVAEWLKEAAKNYPESWIRDAIGEAVSLNKRNWRYIDRILANWVAEGRSDGTHRRDSKAGKSKYENQKYGHMVRH